MAVTGFTACSWNEKNNPDLPRAQVQHDAKYAAALKYDLYAFQELGEKQDHEDFQAVLKPADFYWLTPNRAISLALRKTKFDVHTAGYVLCHKGIAGVTPNRGFGWAIVSLKGSDKDFCVIYTHTVSAAWSDRKVKMKAKRKTLWNTHWHKMVDEFAQQKRAEGYSVILLGDLNRIKLPKLPSGWRVLSEHGLDHILWAPGKGSKTPRVKTLTKGKITHPLYTDHLPVWAKVTLT
jgi:hypothetical protein